MNLEELQKLATYLKIDLENPKSGKGTGRGSKTTKTVKQLISEIKVEQDKNKPNVQQQEEPVYAYSGKSTKK